MAPRSERERAEGVRVTGLEAERKLRPPVSENPPMARTQPTVVLSRSQDIPFNKADVRFQSRDLYYSDFAAAFIFNRFM